MTDQAFTRVTPGLKLSPAQIRMLKRGNHHRVDVARSAAECSAWRRTRDSLVRLGLVKPEWPRDSRGLVVAIELTPEGEDAANQARHECQIAQVVA